jgi:hypothetical protein
MNHNFAVIMNEATLCASPPASVVTLSMIFLEIEVALKQGLLIKKINIQEGNFNRSPAQRVHGRCIDESAHFFVKNLFPCHVEQKDLELAPKIKKVSMIMGMLINITKREKR